MKKLKWIAVIVAVLMVAMAYVGALGMNAQNFSAFHQLEKLGRGCVTVASALALVLAWLSCKLEKPLHVIGISTGAAGVIALLVMAGADHAAIKHFLLIFALLLAIIALVGSMIHRQMAQRNR